MTVTFEWIDRPDPIFPKIADEGVFQFYDNFTHLVKDGDVYRVALHEPNIYVLCSTSCIWSPLLTEEREFEDITRCVHFFSYCNYYGFFKPSIAEVAAVTPLKILKKQQFDAFYIDDHIKILKSGRFQLATAVFVKMC